MHRRTTSSFLSLHSHHHLCSPLRLPPSPFVTTPPPSPSKTAIPKSSLPYWSSVSDRDQAESFIRRLAALYSLHCRAQEALRDPWFAPTDAPSHVDLSPTLRQNWSPRAKRIVLTGVWVTNRFATFAASASHLSTQSNGTLGTLKQSEMIEELSPWMKKYMKRQDGQDIWVLFIRVDDVRCILCTNRCFVVCFPQYDF